MSLSDRIAAYVQAEVARTLGKGMATLAVATVVTSPSQVTSLPLTVIPDGSALAVPVKQVRGLPMSAGARVVMGKFGSDWVILGGLTNPATGTGTSRIVIGADVPPELRTYGIDTAIISYLNDKTTNIEAGYFFIGSSNRFDGGASDNRVLAFGNVVYPTLGDPLSATQNDVKTNFQQNMNSPYPQTIFKDQEVVFWTDARMDLSSGANKFDVQGTKLYARIDANDIRAGQPGTASTVETWHAATLLNTWANFGGAFVTTKYRYIASPPKSVEIIGTITNGTNANGTVLFTLPTGYRPATQQRNVIYAFGGTLNIAGETPAVDTATTGNVTCLGCVNATILTFHYIVSLDA